MYPYENTPVCTRVRPSRHDEQTEETPHYKAVRFLAHPARPHKRECELHLGYIPGPKSPESRIGFGLSPVFADQSTVTDLPHTFYGFAILFMGGVFGDS